MRGFAFRTVLDCIDALRGQGSADEVLGQLPPGVAAALTPASLDPDGWYPVEWYAALLRCARAAGGGSDFILAIGREAPNKDVKRLYQSLMRWLSPKTIMTFYARLFDKLYSAGSLLVQEHRDGYLRIGLVDCTGFSEEMWIEILGSAERLLEMSGAQQVRGRIVIGGKPGDDWAIMEGRWSG